MTKKIAFLGLGVMGGPMSANLARQGHLVKVWNRTSDRPGIRIAEQAGGIYVPTIAEAIKDAEFIFSCVSDVPDVEEVLLGKQGVINFALRGALIVDFSTIGTPAAQKLARELKKQQLRFLDAPVSGGDIGAQKGILTIMVGGEKADFEEVLPLLQTMGKNIYYCGGVGSGQAVKMCNQVLGAIHMVALCEAMQMAKYQGIDPNLIIEVCSTGAAGSWALSNLGPKIVDSDYNPGFMIKHILKDLRLVQDTIKASDNSLPGVELAEHLFKMVNNLDNGQGAQQGTQAMIRAYLQMEQ
jgi:3-hydroxyisobutyrate dehydrogenase